MGTTATAWPDAEREVFDWLLALMTATEDTDAFIGELPKNLDLVQDQYFAWMIQGGNDVLDDFNEDEPGGCGEWGMNSQIQAVFKTRTLMQTFDGKLRAALPLATGTLTGITRLKRLQEPSTQRSIIELKEDQASGGEFRVWAYQLPMWTIFTVQP